ncbi:Spt4/RpoE2 zinc finger-domain-containing protein [Haematococcus lacustris]|nr:hypothetical protein QJQ45_016849 [Haematococcus lacustris]KAJ9516100.1 hypothetical protein QJQ45_024530 [Haematococcus lacustris]KAJ9516153.1 hypothetical protein QJQ45_024585 [Haematococcus lacustris]
MPRRPAAAPALHAEVAEFAHINKAMRCCFVCRLVKTEHQFLSDGCDNCSWLEMKEDRDKVQDYTTPSFSGLITVMDPSTSWATKWLHLSKHAPGAYAMVVNDEPPDSLRSLLEDRNIKVAHLQQHL